MPKCVSFGTLLRAEAPLEFGSIGKPVLDRMARTGFSGFRMNRVFAANAAVAVAALEAAAAARAWAAAGLPALASAVA